MKYEINDKLVVDILNYFTTRPLGEVIAMFDELRFMVDNNKITENKEGDNNGN